MSLNWRSASRANLAHVPLDDRQVYDRNPRSLIGTVAAAGLSVGLVSRAHGDLRLGLAPFVQLAESVGAVAMLNPCARRRAGPRFRCRALGRRVSKSVAKPRPRVSCRWTPDPEHLPGDNGIWRTLRPELSFLRIPGPTWAPPLTT